MHLAGRRSVGIEEGQAGVDRIQGLSQARDSSEIEMRESKIVCFSGALLPKSQIKVEGTQSTENQKFQLRLDLQKPCNVDSLRLIFLTIYISFVSSFGREGSQASYPRPGAGVDTPRMFVDLARCSSGQPPYQYLGGFRKGRRKRRRSRRR